MADNKDLFEDGGRETNDNRSDQLNDWISMIDHKKHRNRIERERLRDDLEAETMKIAESAEEGEEKRE
jgi:gas vesicle protein